jgi:hypothetical protein
MDLRTLILGLGAFCTSFLAGWWFNIGALIHGPRASQMQQPAAVASAPSATTGQAQPTMGSHIVVPVPVRSPQSSTPAAKDAAKKAVVKTAVAQARSPKVPASNVAYAKDLPSQSAEKRSSRRSGFRFRRR